MRDEPLGRCVVLVDPDMRLAQGEDPQRLTGRDSDLDREAVARLELTQHLCADPTIRFADSTAAPDHPMINPIWRGRLAIGDVLIPLRRRDPVVTLIRAALALRHAVREPARRVVRLLRQSREHRQEKSA